MATCPNCRNKMSCGCQKRQASDGKTVCSKCANTYEEQLKQRQTLATVSQTNQVWGKDRYTK
jgi:transcription initiation factor TFIIIB Brf1 subunit/transcription initiation factor TFIIB